MTLELFSLKGKTALVTGATRGIGLSMTIALAEAGAEIILLQRDEAQRHTKDEIKSLGREATIIQCDLSSQESVASAVNQALSRHQVDVVLNCGGMQYRADAEVFPFEEYQKVLQTNLTSAFVICRAVGAYWLTNGNKGNIINVASLASFQGGVRMTAYASSKGGILQLTKALSNEWAGKGIRVNAVAPGYIATDLNKDTRTNPDSTLFDSINARIPAGRWGTADDLRGVAVLLACDASRYITGECITVDGGWMAR